jgi:hypothetical protein
MKENNLREWTHTGAIWQESNHKYYSHSTFSDPIVLNVPKSGNYSTLAAINCLVLLGVPGSGKSTEFKKAKSTIVDKNSYSSIISLGQIESFEYLQTLLLETSEKLNKNTNKVIFFFDAIDESPVSVPVVEQWLISIVSLGKKLFESIGVDLQVRLSCRTADWINKFENDLINIWGKNQVGIYELPPLKIEEVSNIVKGENINADTFLKEIEEIGCQPLAGRPVTLGMLISMYKQNLKLSIDKVALYHQGILALCEESSLDRRYVGNTGNADVKTRFELASELAAATILSNNSLVWDGTYAITPPTNSVKVDQITIGKQGAALKEYLNFIRETLKTPIFLPIGLDTFAWAHQTFAEYLAAYYLVTHTSTLKEVKDFLLSNITDNNFVVPQLREVAGWVSLLKNEFFEYLVETEPELLLSSDVALIRNEDKKKLTEALLESLNQEKLFDNHEWQSKYKNLNHPELPEQLKETIHDKSKSIFARRSAFKIASACNLQELSFDLKDVIFDYSENFNIRKSALNSLLDINPNIFIDDLKALINIDPELDPDDEIKGQLLTYLWPNHLDPEKLFNTLSLPQNRSLIGHYTFFLYSLKFESLDEKGAIDGIKWLYSANKYNDEFHFNEIINSLLIVIWKHVDNKKVLSELSKLIIHHINSGSLLNFNNSDFIKVYKNALPLKRKSLFQEIINNIPDDWDNTFHLTYSPWQIVFKEDIPWLIEIFLNKKDDSNNDIYQELIFRLISLEDKESWEKLFKASENDPDLALTIEKNTTEYLQDVHVKWKSENYSRDKVDREQKQKAIPLIEVAQLSIEKTEADISYWWKLNLNFLETSNDSAYVQEHSGSLDLGIWKSLTELNKQKVISLAKQYLYNFEIESIRYLEPNTFSRPAAAGYRAFRLLYSHDAETYKKIPKRIWQKWVLALLTFSSDGSETELNFQSEILKDAYLIIKNEFLRGLSKVSKDKLNLNESLKLCEKWLDEELLDTFWNIFQDRKDKEPNEHHIWSFFYDNNYSPAISEAIKKLSEVLDHNFTESNTDNNIKIISSLVNSHPDLLFDKLEFLKMKNEKYFYKLIIEISNQINVNNFLSADKSNCLKLARIFVWLQSYTDDSGEVSTNNNLSFFQSRVVNQLVGLGTHEAVQAISWISSELPNVSWLKWSLTDVKENERKAFHYWLSPNQILWQLNLKQSSTFKTEKQYAITKAADIEQSISIEFELEQNYKTLPESDKLKILLVATEWFQNKGGISIINRCLAIELSKSGHKVYCFMPLATKEEIDDANLNNIEIIIASPSPGLIESDLLIAGPSIDHNLNPDLVIGHSHVTGPSALRLSKQIYKCSYVHMFILCIL